MAEVLIETEASFVLISLAGHEWSNSGVSRVYKSGMLWPRFEEWGRKYLEYGMADRRVLRTNGSVSQNWRMVRLSIMTNSCIPAGHSTNLLSG